VTFSTSGVYTVSFTVRYRFGLVDPTPEQRVIIVNPLNKAPDDVNNAPPHGPFEKVIQERQANQFIKGIKEFSLLKTLITI